MTGESGTHVPDPGAKNPKQPKQNPKRQVSHIGGAWDPELARRLADRARMEDDTGCWIWLGATKRGGYGHISVSDKMVLVHRAAWNLVMPAIDSDLEIDHLCKVRGCFNPAHLEPVSKAENVRRTKPGYEPEEKVNPRVVNRYVINYDYLRFRNLVKEYGEYDPHTSDEVSTIWKGRSTDPNWKFPKLSDLQKQGETNDEEE